MYKYQRNKRKSSPKVHDNYRLNLLFSNNLVGGLFLPKKYWMGEYREYLLGRGSNISISELGSVIASFFR